jgi:mRNA-degrading endonuclease RelE of RelBE toxin-antitoxin system
MRYAVFILRRAQKELAELPAEAYEHAKEAIELSTRSTMLKRL